MRMLSHSYVPRLSWNRQVTCWGRAYLDLPVKLCPLLFDALGDLGSELWNGSTIAVAFDTEAPPGWGGTAHRAGAPFYQTSIHKRAIRGAYKHYLRYGTADGTAGVVAGAGEANSK